MINKTFLNGINLFENPISKRKKSLEKKKLLSEPHTAEHSVSGTYPIKRYPLFFFFYSFFFSDTNMKCYNILTRGIRPPT